MTDETAYVRAYSRALFGAARQSTSIPAVRADLETVLRMLTESEELRRWMTRRVPSTPARRSEEVRRRLGASVGPAVRCLLLQMASWNHLHLIPSVARRFENAVRLAEGRRTAHVVCAQESGEPLLTVLRSRLQPAAGTLDFEVRVDPSLLAGLTVRMEDRVLDASLSGRLARLRRALVNPSRAPSAASATA